MATFLTGATGFIGGAILDRLLREGQRVLTLVRQEEAARRIATKGAIPVLGDLLDPATYRDPLGSCDLLYHVAGVNAFCLHDPTSLYRVNVEGTKRLLTLAGEVGLRRVVYTSSALTIGEPPGQIAKEETPHRGYFLSHYERAKYEAEQMVLAMARQGLPVVIINPSSVQGPGRLHGTARIFLDYLNGNLPCIFGETVSLVYIDDCVEAHLKAAERGRVGERYLVSAPPIALEEFFRVIAELTGLTGHPRRIGPSAAFALGIVGEWTARLRGRRPRLCREMVRTILHGPRYDSSKAERELGITFLPLREMATRTVAWYVETGHVRRPLPRFSSGRSVG